MLVNTIRRRLAGIERPLLVRHLVFGLVLVPVPLFRTGSLEFLLLTIILPSPDGFGFAAVFVFLVSLFSLPLIPLFVAWCLPGARRPGLPKRSIALLCLLIAYHPFRYYLDEVFYGEETLAEIARIHEQFPIVWAIKHLDTPLVLGLAASAVLQHRTAGPDEKIWFHWLLFICAIWSGGAFFDVILGISLPVDTGAPGN